MLLPIMSPMYEYTHVQEITTEMGILQESPLLGTVVECLECLEMMFVKRIEIAWSHLQLSLRLGDGNGGRRGEAVDYWMRMV